MRSIVYKPDFTPRQLTFGQVPCFVYTKSLDDELASGLGPEEAIFMFRLMLYNRAFEETIVRLRSGDLVPHEGYKFSGATHLSIGQEAVAVGANAALRADDYITSSHRGHGHSIAKEAYALKAMSEAQLQAFIEQVTFVSDKTDLFEKALEVHLYRTMAEFMGKEEGYCRGRGGGMHIADFNVGHLGANAIVGGSIPIATGAGMSVMLQGGDKVVLCFFGDGAANNGVFGESLNMASMSQFSKGIPVIFLIENNQFGMSGRCYGEVTGVDFLARRGWGYKDNGMHAEVVNGMDALAMRDAVSRATEICRKGDGPVLLEAITYRYRGHSLSDQNAYRTKEEIEAWVCEDAIGRMKQQVVRSGLMGPTEAEQMEREYHEQMEKIAIAAATSPYPAPEGVCEGLYSDTTSENVPQEYRTTDYNQDQIKSYRDGQGRMPYRRAILEALVEEMLREGW